jgi:hypothetical protein
MIIVQYVSTTFRSNRTQAEMRRRSLPKILVERE